jgi:hypothetical protein
MCFQALLVIGLRDPSQYPSPPGVLEWYWPIVVGIAALVRILGAIGLVLLKGWGWWVVILTSVVIAGWSIIRELAPYPHVVQIEGYWQVSSLVTPLLYALLLMIPRVKRVFQK